MSEETKCPYECPSGCDESNFVAGEWGESAPYCKNCRTWINDHTIKDFGYLRYKALEVKNE